MERVGYCIYEQNLAEAGFFNYSNTTVKSNLYRFK